MIKHQLLLLYLRKIRNLIYTPAVPSVLRTFSRQRNTLLRPTPIPRFRRSPLKLLNISHVIESYLHLYSNTVITTPVVSW
jgi:hypothetical protein